MIECKKYSLTELKDILKISKRAWETRKEEVLDYLKMFFNYEIEYKGRNTYFIIKEQFNEYEPLPPKKDAEKISAYYKEETRKIIKEDPYNTGSNIARNIIAREENLYEHKEDTVANYIRPIIRKDFLPPMAESSWRRLSANRLSYEPLTQEQLNFLYQLFEDNSLEGRKKKEIEMFAAYKEGYLSEEQLKTFLFNNVSQAYGSLMTKFKAKFGFRPMLIKKLEENAWEVKEGTFEF